MVDVAWFRTPADGDPGTLNACYVALDLPVIRGRADDVALVIDGTDHTFARLLTEVAACAGVLPTRVERELESLGYRVARNTPYAGGYTTEHYGRPARRTSCQPSSSSTRTRGSATGRALSPTSSPRRATSPSRRTRR